jgi:hypothetical protein
MAFIGQMQMALKYWQEVIIKKALVLPEVFQWSVE